LRHATVGAAGLEMVTYKLTNATSSTPMPGGMIPLATSLRMVADVQGAIVTLTLYVGTQTMAHVFAIDTALAPATYFGVAVRGLVDAQFRYLHHVQLK
jgi:hypothetical protein